VTDVVDFVRDMPGCSDYADEFRAQEIDGQALLLLKEDHLMSLMSMKLGPALKVCAKINSMRDEVSH
ncbi:Polyhomeotic-like protein 3, partial [Araneus ventricosus]